MVSGGDVVSQLEEVGRGREVNRTHDLPLQDDPQQMLGVGRVGGGRGRGCGWGWGWR